MEKKTERFKKKAGGYEVHITITAPNQVVDGYLELVAGTFLITGNLVNYLPPCKTAVDDENTMLSQWFILKTPPLGSLGLDDIQDCEDVKKDKK